MNLTLPENLRVLILADKHNRSVPECIAALLRLLKTPQLSSFHLPMNDAGDSSALNEFQALSNLNQVVIASIGVPGHSEYERNIERLLDAWKGTATRPGLILVSSNLKKTGELVGRWLSRHRQDGEMLESGISVAEQSEMTDMGRLLQILNERIRAMATLGSQTSLETASVYYMRSALSA